ncbi:MAG: AAA family ATPase [Anaerolineaceae bacterium]|nr:AAA family ATPase [Anaerolineaceae bacterium]
MMRNDKWIEHLDHWEAFLDSRLSSSTDEGDVEKIRRQQTAIERVRYSAVLNPQLLIEFISPEFLQCPYDEINLDFCLELNDSQQKAVMSAISNKKNLSLIQGPPGTGKTQVISEICLQLYRRNPNIRILVCSETHVAVNNMITRISEFNPSIRCIRIRDKEQDVDVDSFSPKAIMTAYQNWLKDSCDDPDIVRIITELIPEYENRGLEKALALTANVVGLTCNRVGAYHFGDSTEMFDYAIIDEVCKATLPEILMPLIISKKAVLVGDPKQLPPLFCSEDLEIIRNIENCNLDHYLYIDDLFETSGNTIKLNTQYRMEESIGTLISELFYDGFLKNGRNMKISNSLLWANYTPSQMWPVSNNKNIDKVEIFNIDECKVIKQILDQLNKQCEHERTIDVIVPYRNQVIQLRKTISDYRMLKITIDTVDSFQGKECDIVIFGITRTKGSYRFFADKRRLNVALSRAKDQVIIVGFKNYAKKNALLNNIMNLCKEISVEE